MGQCQSSKARTMDLPPAGTPPTPEYTAAPPPAPPPAAASPKAASATANGGGAHAPLPLGVLVKIFTVEATINYALPWQVEEQLEFTGSGFAIEGRRIVTNAHVVASAVSVRVRREGFAEKTEARILAVCPEADLAVLTVAGDAFWAGEPVTRLAPALPVIGESTTVIGYPTGGEQVSVTKGVVSRIDVLRYTGYAMVEPLLVVQIDAAINAGNSGGPVFNAAMEVVGVAFCKDGDDASDNIGYLIPADIVRLFFGEVARLEAKQRGPPYLVPGVAGLGVTTQTAESAHLRRYRGLAGDETGVVVTRVAPLSPLRGVVAPGAVLLAIDGVPIANDGSVPLPGDGGRPRRVDYDHLATSKPTGSEVVVRVLERGARADHAVTLAPIPRLVPCFHGLDAHPTFFVVGGLVFAPLSMPLVDVLDTTAYDDATTLAIRHACSNAEKKTADQQVVVLQRILVAADVNGGYDDAAHAPTVLDEVDGAAVGHMRDLVRLVDAATGPFLTFKFKSGTVVALDRALCARRDPDILRENAIPARSSADLEDAAAAAAGAWCGSLFARSFKQRD